MKGYPPDIYHCDNCQSYSILLHKVDGQSRWLCPQCAVRNDRKDKS